MPTYATVGLSEIQKGKSAWNGRNTDIASGRVKCRLET